MTSMFCVANRGADESPVAPRPALPHVCTQHQLPDCSQGQQEIPAAYQYAPVVTVRRTTENDESAVCPWSLPGFRRPATRPLGAGGGRATKRCDE